ncbi:MAG: DUF4190 domain-containing protein [Phycisphaerales bacterium]|nr:DUF4190 domain-containing protein [Phycisphaerales bacterium]
MTQFDSSFDRPIVTSRLAITALVCSLVFFCPLTTLIAPLLGVIAIFTIGSNPHRKGIGLAATAIVLGLAFTVGQAFIGYKTYSMFIGPIRVGPRDALAVGSAGDIVGFQNSFHGPGATADEAVARVFLDELTARYGGFVGCTVDLQTQAQTTPGQPAVPFVYILTFEKTTVSAEAEIIIADPTTGEFISKLGYIQIFDEEAGDLHYPPESDDTDEALP